MGRVSSFWPQMTVSKMFRHFESSKAHCSMSLHRGNYLWSSRRSNVSFRSKRAPKRDSSAWLFREPDAFELSGAKPTLIFRPPQVAVAGGHTQNTSQSSTLPFNVG